MKRVVWLGCLVLFATMAQASEQCFEGGGRITRCVEAAHAKTLKPDASIALHGQGFQITSAQPWSKSTMCPESNRRLVETGADVQLAQGRGCCSKKIKAAVRLTVAKVYADNNILIATHETIEHLEHQSCYKLAIAATAAVAGLLCLVLSTQAGSMPS